MIAVSFSFNFYSMGEGESRAMLLSGTELIIGTEGYVSHNFIRTKNGNRMFVLEVYFTDENAADVFQNDVYSKWNSFLAGIQSLAHVTGRMCPVESIGSEGCAG